MATAGSMYSLPAAWQAPLGQHSQSSASRVPGLRTQLTPCHDLGPCRAGIPASEGAASSDGDIPDEPAEPSQGAGAPSGPAAEDLAHSLANMKIARTQQQLAAASGTVRTVGSMLSSPSCLLLTAQHAYLPQQLSEWVYVQP
jgi:hypothetical protein